jgi:hypothetical protein
MVLRTIWGDDVPNLDLWHFALAIFGLTGGTLASYFGARNAMAVSIAKVEAAAAAAAKDAALAISRADDAHDRLDRFLRLRSPDSTR